MIQRRLTLAALGLSSLLGFAGTALADASYPDRTVKVIVALPAGGSADMIARTVSQKLSTALGQSFVVDNRGGASGQIGMPAVAKAAPDGYTLTISPASFLTTNSSIFQSLPYKAESDFVPITRLVNQPMVLIVKDKAKYPNVAAVLAAAKKDPGKLTYASSGEGSPQHLAALMFQTMTKTEMLHVPYKGGAPAINDTLGGNVDLMFAVMPEALPHVQTGKLHALGTMAPKRPAPLADTPTMVESGHPNLNLSAWVGLLAPANTPAAIIEKLNKTVHTVLDDAELKAKLAASGMEVAPGTPEELKQAIAQETKLHAELVKAAGIKPQ